MQVEMLKSLRFSEHTEPYTDKNFLPDLLKKIKATFCIKILFSSSKIGLCMNDLIFCAQDLKFPGGDMYFWYFLIFIL